MSCPSCKDTPEIDAKAGMYVSRPCPDCGREIAMRPSGKSGGLHVEKGDGVHIPEGWLQISANPLKGRGHLTRAGVDWYARLMILGDVLKRKDDFTDFVRELRDINGERLEPIARANGLTLSDGETLIEKLKEDTSQSAWWLMLYEIMAVILQDALKNEDAQTAAWAAVVLERARSIYVFKEQFEDVVNMGHSARRLVDLFQIWEANKNRDDEEFWQIQFQSYPLALAQIFSSAVTYIKGKAYVGGQRVDGKNAKLVDFLLSGGSGSDAILVEIKTPKKKLLRKSAYRGGVYPVSADVAGATTQVLEYRRSLISDLENLKKGTAHEFQAVNPRAVVIIGNSGELDTVEKRSSFETFRRNSANVDILTFDEVFEKLSYLASIFGLSKTESAPEAQPEVEKARRNS